ncbi:hypothetical protein ACFPRA_07320 [Sporosarcina soli]|uniref:Uncharacterized protein n=1 Tax=Sporosarcina soli TaxID=334736 RepID=A0ABW0TIG4_9BACL
MLIGMVLAKDKETIVPIVDGEIARIYNLESGEIIDSPNPAREVSEGKRGATVKWMVQNDVKVLCAPPGTLCELSYSRAQTENLNFCRVDPGTSFSSLKSHIENGELRIVDSLPNNEIELSAKK